MIFWLALLTSGAAVEAESPALLDRIVAQVDESVILWSELNLRVLTELEQISDPRLDSPERIAELRERALSAMGDDEVLVLKARKDSIEIDVSEVEEVLKMEMERIKSRLGEGEFDAMLERTGLTQRQLKSRYRKQIRHRMLYDR